MSAARGVGALGALFFWIAFHCLAVLGGAGLVPGLLLGDGRLAFGGLGNLLKALLVLVPLGMASAWYLLSRSVDVLEGSGPGFRTVEWLWVASLLPAAGYGGWLILR